MKSEEKGISRRSFLKAASSIGISAVSTPSLSGTRWFHNHLLHFMVFFIITALPILSPSFSFLASLFAIP
ncbi:MAG: twin-arginine translocation signal domain-containing protein [Syntrophobacteraceae bacterium]|nr:twin-arginine translocation signal domain-containing protein [Syntrophobacteraceae bacterium]